MTAVSRFALRRREKLRSSLRYAGWWDAALPAAIGSAIAALILVAVMVNTPLEAFAYVALYLDRTPRIRWIRMSFRCGMRRRQRYRPSSISSRAPIRHCSIIWSTCAPRCERRAKKARGSTFS
jgi:hypothetical protein